MKQLTIYRTTFTDTYDGELVDPDTTEEVVSCEPDELDREDGLTAVDMAVTYLSDESITSPSQSSIPAVGYLGSLWWQYVDGSYISNEYTGERTEVTAHPAGFTDDELRAIATKLAGTNCPQCDSPNYTTRCSSCGYPTRTYGTDY
jgi:hypothetical protein